MQLNQLIIKNNKQMKRTNFLKLFFVSIIMMFTIGTFSCKDPAPACEENNTCVVTIRNNASIAIWVDCTEGSDDYNAERRIMPGSSTSYTVHAGDVTVWGASDSNRTANRWNYDDLYVSACEDFTYTWSNKKSLVEGESSLGTEEGFGVPKNKE